MPRADASGRIGGPSMSGAPDTRLAELLRAAPALAYPALRELRERHEPYLLDYARLCTVGETAARGLAARAFALAARETAHGNDPGLPWRHHLLLLSCRLAADWAGDDRAASLNTAVVTTPVPTPPLLPAFRSLSSRTQALLWYGLVEREPAPRTAAFLGLPPEDITPGVAPALQTLARTALRLRLTASPDPDCADFHRLIEESVRPDTPRHSADLTSHKAHCSHCTAAYEEQCALRDAPAATLAEGLLPWAGTAYAAERRTAAAATAEAVGGRQHPSTPATTPPPLPTPLREQTPATAWPPPRRFVLASAALGVALAPLLLLLSPGDAPTDPATDTVAATPRPLPPVTVPPPQPSPAPASPSPSPSPSRTATSPTPTPTPPPTPARTPTAPPKTPKPTPKPQPAPTYPPGAAYAQVVNLTTGRCLEVAGDFTNGTDVVTVPCSASPSQRWRYDADLGVLQSYADPDYCLDSRGSTDRGAGIWTCSSVYGPNGRNLTFLIPSDGTIRPAIDPDTTLTDNGYGDVWFQPPGWGGGQRWGAGQ
ncbi:ricin-type beta-trefoil lectin domain protein [Streptomyces sp. bgisy153]|uniref:ricin-type beta-trefoil lectin domain protein n=1 Tax=Streptomyces sp. bgisy153 TaxID=3413793 RepID=UPI003D75DEED